MSNNNNPIEVSDDSKRWSKAADEKVRKMFLSDARKKCDDYVKKFVNCSKENGLLVVWKCRQENRDMNDCVHQYTTDAKWEEFRATKIDQYMKEGKLKISASDAFTGPPK